MAGVSLAYVPPEVRLHGRGAGGNTPNRFERLRYESDPDAAGGSDPSTDVPSLRTEFFRDATRTVLATNDSPDIPFDVSLNPYRGCEHGCAYCYARPTHEYLGFSAGLDFESRILVKEDAPELLRKELSSPRWEPRTVALSGVTDPYQPVERRRRLTRRCLEVFLDFRNPVGVYTAPVIPGLTDHEIPGLLAAAKEAGARFAGWVPLRLPHAVAPLFVDWLERCVPLRKEKVLSRLRDLRGGRLNDPAFGTRMRGEGVWAEQIADLFRVAAKKAGLALRGPDLSTAAFRVPPGPQLSLFP